MSYTVQTRNSVRKDVKKIPEKILQKIFDEIDMLSGNPYPDGVKKIEGRDDLYRVRVGDYRVIYEVDDKAKTLLIVCIRHRKDVYRGL